MIPVRDFPGFALLMLGGAGLMLVPAIMGAATNDWPVARVFLDHAVFFAIAAVILGLAMMNRVPAIAARYHLVTILLAYALLPAMLAAPFRELAPGISFGAAYFEMLSSLTTTGATLFDRHPQLLSPPLHLWRALIGWVGGLMILVIAFAILAPLNLGGFEFAQTGASHRDGRRSATIEEAGRRISRFSGVIAPIYTLCTGILTLVLIFAGDSAFVALCHAMGTLSTSGISPVGGLQNGQSGRFGEIAIAVMLLPAVSHRFLNYDRRARRRGLVDPQARLMLICVFGVTLVLFSRAWLGAVEIERQGEVARSLHALWGGFFTSLSFLTTTGYESADWRTMQLWSNLPTPGVILMGLAVIGGGAATTAGGVKLLRVYALYRHGLREMDLLTHPSAMIRLGRGERLISRDGARIAFLFLMLFLIAIALAMLGLSATGLDFESSLMLAIAALTNTGPLAHSLGEGMSYSSLADTALAILCAAMIVGRMEILVIVALFNPAFWRR